MIFREQTVGLVLYIILFLFIAQMCLILAEMYARVS